MASSDGIPVASCEIISVDINVAFYPGQNNNVEVDPGASVWLSLWI